MNDKNNTNTVQTCVQLVDDGGDIYVLPYGHMLCAILTRKKDPSTGTRDILKIDFAVHTAKIEGGGLEALLDPLRRMTLKSISKDSAKAIESIKIQVRRPDEQ